MSGERFTLDTNILVYSVDLKAGFRRDVAVSVIQLAMARDCHVTLRAIGEFFAVTTRKGMMPRADAAAQANDWVDIFSPISATVESTRAALAFGLAGIVAGVQICNPFGSDGLSVAAQAFLKC